MLHAYAFLVSGLLVPMLFGLFSKKPSSAAALAAMLSGGTTTLGISLSYGQLAYGIDPNLAGIGISLFAYLLVSGLENFKMKTTDL